MHKATEQLLLWPETSSQGQRQTVSWIETNLHNLRQAVMARDKLSGPETNFIYDRDLHGLRKVYPRPETKIFLVGDKLPLG